MKAEDKQELVRQLTEEVALMERARKVHEEARTAAIRIVLVLIKVGGLK
jgi:hypothetical protein